MTCYRATVRQF